MNDTLEALYGVILDRKINAKENSYTAYLFREGIDKILKKVGEECTETIVAAKNGIKSDVVAEISDLIYHLLVMMVNEKIPLSEVMDELDRRAKKTGNLKQFHVTDKNT